EDGQGRPLGVCPRQLFKRVLARAAARGLVPDAGLEYEWFNFQETPQSWAAKGHTSPQPLTPGMFGYSILRAAHSRPYFTALFDDEADPHRLSRTFRSYLAGLVRALPDLLPFFAPTVNSYKRLVEGFWAPTRVTWGVDNRTVAFRVIPGSAKSTRLEVRVGGAD